MSRGRKCEIGWRGTILELISIAGLAWLLVGSPNLPKLFLPSEPQGREQVPEQQPANEPSWLQKLFAW